MNRAISLLLAATLLASNPAQARDSRLVEVFYNADEVVRIEGRTNVQATIQFGETERIENVAIGDSSTWQITPNKRANLLFVKPLAPRGSTNMTVITDKRTYLFDLVANPKAKALYVLRFTYPDEPEEVEEPVLAELGEPRSPNAVELAAATDPYAVTDPALINYEWATKGSPALLPSQAYDDGEATFLVWEAGRPVPAILIKDHEGTEGPVNYAVRGDMIVVDGVPREIVLRSGEDVATLTNKGPIRSTKTSSNTALARAGGRK